MSGQSSRGIQYFWVPRVCRKLVSRGGGVRCAPHAAFAVEMSDESHFFVYCPGVLRSFLVIRVEDRRTSPAKSGEGASEQARQGKLSPEASKMRLQIEQWTSARCKKPRLGQKSYICVWDAHQLNDCCGLVDNRKKNRGWQLCSYIIRQPETFPICQTRR